ncbi:curli assembly protein CsgC [Azoarcus sp. Aa7]|nr:curli assembly protein CsgC [Azoarcus sp. Aa7]
MDVSWWRCAPLILLLAAGIDAMAASSAVRLWADVTRDGNRWTVVPHVAADAGRVFRYEMSTSKEGPSGRSTTRQGGRLASQDESARPLATVQVELGAQDHCEVLVLVLEGDVPVGDLSLKLPD